MSRSARLWLLVVPAAVIVGAASSVLIAASDHEQPAHAPSGV
jgi:hypothetical protein